MHLWSEDSWLRFLRENPGRIAAANKLYAYTSSESVGSKGAAMATAALLSAFAKRVAELGVETSKSND